MSKVTICFLLMIGILGTLAYTSAGIEISTSDDTTQVQEEPLANIFSRWLVDTLSRKITEISRFFNLKIRVIKFLASLYTTENLVLLRNVTEYAVRIGKITLKFLPASVEDPGYWWISSLVQFLNSIHVGNGSLFDQFLGPVTTVSVSTEDITGSQPETVELSTRSPVTFNAPTSQQQTEEAVVAVSYENNNEASQPKAAEEDDFSESETNTNEELLSSYEGRIMTLNKLINIKRK